MAASDANKSLDIKSFDVTAPFTSLVGAFGAYHEDMTTNPPSMPTNIDGPQQSAMTPTDILIAPSSVTYKGLHNSPNGDADPDWNTTSNPD